MITYRVCHDVGLNDSAAARSVCYVYTSPNPSAGTALFLTSLTTSRHARVGESSVRELGSSPNAANGTAGSVHCSVGRVNLNHSSVQGSLRFEPRKHWVWPLPSINVTEARHSHTAPPQQPSRINGESSLGHLFISDIRIFTVNIT
jgi:hypothetical protein